MLTLLPDFLIIGFGTLIASRFADSTWQQIDKLCYYVFYPSLLFSAASQRPIEVDDLVTIGSFSCMIVSTGFLLSLVVRRFSTQTNPATVGGVSQNAWRFNTALGFVAVAALPPAATSVMAITVGIAIPLANFFAVLSMARSQIQSTALLVKEIALNPFLLSSLAGVLIGIFGNPLPSILTSSIDRLAEAAIPLVLLSLGAALSQSRLWPIDPHSISVGAIKLLVLPSCVWLAITLADQSGIIPATLLMFAALPTASAAHVLATRYGGSRQVVAISVMQSTAVGLITLPLWAIVATRIAGLQ